MRWGAWTLTALGVVFIGVGIYGWSEGPAGLGAPAGALKDAVLVAPMIIGGSVLLAAGVALMSCGWGCYGCDWDDGSCGCGHCEGCKGGKCCGHCGCENEVPHEHGPEGHHH